jgi:hypothetical protein
MPFGSLLPWRRFSLDTAWSPTDVERELGFLLDASHAHDNDFAVNGSRWLGGFRMSPRGPAGNSIIMSGRVRPTSLGSRVVVNLRLPLRATLLLALTVPLLTLLSAAVSIAALVRHEGIVLLIWTMPFAIWGGIVRPFLVEARKAEECLRKFFPPPRPPTAGPFR